MEANTGVQAGIVHEKIPEAYNPKHFFNKDALDLDIECIECGAEMKLGDGVARQVVTENEDGDEESGNIVFCSLKCFLAWMDVDMLDRA